MKCANCPLFSSWNNENDRGEQCGLFGDDWSDPLMREDANGTVIGCYVDRHYIEKVNQRYLDHLEKMANSYFDDTIFAKTFLASSSGETLFLEDDA